VPKNIIRDGYTRTAKLEPRPGLHDGLSFRFRPMLAHQVDAVTDSVRKCRDRGQYQEARLVVARAMEKQLAEWDESADDGAPVPIKASEIALLPPAMLTRLFDIVSGFDPGDLPTDATDEEQDEYLRCLTESHETGKAPGRIAEEADEKNSAAG